jgi:hypothetical protein
MRISPLWKNKPSKKAEEAGFKLMKVINTNIPLKTMARQLEENMRKYAAVGRERNRWTVMLEGSGWDLFPWPSYST